MMPIELITESCRRCSFAVTPTMQRDTRIRQASVRWVSDWNKQCAMMGSNALSCSCPASAAILIVTSLPTTSNATWLTTSGMTGLTLPGMMLEPGCTAGRLISLNPDRGPEDNSRRSLQILDNLSAVRFSTPDSCTNAPTSWVASTRSGAVVSENPLISVSLSHTRCAYRGWALSPVPMAVPPRLISDPSCAASSSRSASSATMIAYVPNSCPNVIGTASCNCVRPIFNTDLNSSALRPNAAATSNSVVCRVAMCTWRATLIAVGYTSLVLWLRFT